MGIFDKAKDALSAHPDKVDAGLDKLAEVADRRTGGQHGEHIDRGVGVAKAKLGDALGRTDPPAGAPVPPA